VKKAKQTTWRKILYWAPRIISILFILFLTMFSFDVFGTGAGFWMTLAAFLIHNIPSFVLTALLIVAWRYEIVGGFTFVIAGLLYIAFAIKAAFDDLPWYLALSWSMIIALPAMIIGGLWFANWFYLRKKKAA
jgi:hypothetical protein